MKKWLTPSLAQFFPYSPSPKSALHSPITCALRSSNDYDRQERFLIEAEQAGKTVIRGEVDASRRRMGVSVVVLNEGAKGEESGLATEEVFGPVLAIIPVKVRNSNSDKGSADRCVGRRRSGRVRECQASTFGIIRVLCEALRLPR